MSALTRHSDHMAPGLAAERLRRIQRARRVEAGNVTEMARSLLREARVAQDTLGARPSGESQAGRARGVAMRAGGPARRRSSPGLMKRPLAAGRA
jgi:hypothetical protein